MRSQMQILLVACGALALSGLLGEARAQVTRNGTKLSSEIITALGLESELTDDIYSASGGILSSIIVYGGPYGNSNTPSTYTIRIYNDVGCIPDLTPVAIFPGLTGAPWNTGTLDGGFPLYMYTFSPLNFVVPPGGYYWISVQADAHVYPDQWGVQLVSPMINCSPKWRSVYFGYPNWVEESMVDERDVRMEVLITPLTGACCLDAAVQCIVMTRAECDALGGRYQGDNAPCVPDPCGNVPVENRTWGQIKAGYR